MCRYFFVVCRKTWFYVFGRGRLRLGLLRRLPVRGCGRLLPTLTVRSCWLLRLGFSLFCRLLLRLLTLLLLLFLLSFISFSILIIVFFEHRVDSRSGRRWRCAPSSRCGPWWRCCRSLWGINICFVLFIVKQRPIRKGILLFWQYYCLSLEYCIHPLNTAVGFLEVSYVLLKLFGLLSICRYHFQFVE